MQEMRTHGVRSAGPAGEFDPVQFGGVCPAGAPAVMVVHVRKRGGNIVAVLLDDVLRILSAIAVAEARHGD